MNNQKSRFTVLFVLLTFFIGQGFLAGESAEKRAIGIKDALAWKSIRGTSLSADGQWFAFALSPNRGDSQVVIRQTRGKKKHTFDVGQGGISFAGAALFSYDSKFAAFKINPSEAESKKLRKQKKRVTSKLALLNLVSGKKVEYDKIRNFRFSGENPLWLALHKYSPEGQQRAKDKWNGADLILRDLKNGTDRNIGNVAEFAFDKKGNWLAMVIDAQDKGGNGLHLLDLQSGKIKVMENDSAVYRSLNWTEKGEALALLKGREDKGFKDKLYSVIGISGFDGKSTRKVVYDPATDKSFPEGMTISPNSRPGWTDDFTALVFGIHEAEKSDKPPVDKTKKTDPSTDKKAADPEKKPDPEDIPDLVIWHDKDPRLQSMQQVQSARDKTYSYTSIYRVKEKRFLRLADDSLRRVTLAPKQRFAVGYDNSRYELGGNLDGRRYQDIYIVDLKTGKRKLVLEKARWVFSTSPDGTKLLYYEKGHFQVYDMVSGNKTNISQATPASFINAEDDHNVIDPPCYPFNWVADSGSILLTDNWDIWQVPVSGAPGKNLTVKGKESGIRFRRPIRLDPEAKGTDLSKPVYLSVYGEWTKKSGFGLLSKGKSGVKMLLWENAVFTGLMKARKADVYLYTRQTFKDYPNYIVSNSQLKKGKQISDANPQQREFNWTSGARLIDYTSDKGDKLQAALFLPGNYEEGKSYPTLVYFYEKLSQGLNRYTSPRAYGFNTSEYTSRGYAVLNPDITYTVNDPGMSAVWCLLPAVKAAVKTGIVDPDNIGIQGHSWGGYQTAFLITQTDTFKAAVAGAPLTNMISMYSSIYWNSGSANMAIFETSQGRFKGGYWDNLEAYTRNSPVYFAEKVNTPLIILHNDKDGAVDWNQGIEYYNTLRRLGKPVIMLQYKGENHGLRKSANRIDYAVRMAEFFDHHLQGKPAPAWMTDGVSHLDHKEHIEDRVKKLNDKLKNKGIKKKEIKKVVKK